MLPPVFTTCIADPNVVAALGEQPTRLYPFGEAPQGTATPYAVWQLIGGAPDNYLGCRPTHDQYSVQIDVYADTGSQAVTVAEYLRDSIELTAHVVGWRIHGRDPDTRRYRVGFDVDWIVLRPPYMLTPAYQQYAAGYGVYRRQFDTTMNARWAAA